MSITIQAKTDYSFLFSSLGSGAAGVAGSTFLLDYASIKNGSYLKLMKAYYAEDANDTVKSLVNSDATGKADSKTLARVQTTADALKESADALLEKSSDSVFTKKDITTVDENGVESTQKGYDTESIYKAVNSFVTNFNAVVDAVNDSGSESITKRAESMVNATISNLKLLNKIGITLNDDSTLSLDKDTFMEADMTTVKSLFGENGSYGYRVSAQSSLIGYAADREANRTNTYTFTGGYSSLYNAGSLFNGYF